MVKSILSVVYAGIFTSFALGVRDIQSCYVNPKCFSSFNI